MSIPTLSQTLRGVAFAAIACFAAPAMASSISVTNVAFSDGAESVTVTSFGTFGGGTFNAGRFALTVTPAAPPVTAWCVDLFRSISLGPVSLVYTLDNLSDPPPIDPTGIYSAAQISRVTGLSAYGNAQLALNPGNSVISAAVQAAIWHTIAPLATVTSSNGAVQALLTTLNGMSFAGTGGNRLANFTDQTLLTLGAQTLFTGGTPVPVPGALALFAVALIGGFALTRRRAA